MDPQATNYTLPSLSSRKYLTSTFNSPKKALISLSTELTSVTQLCCWSEAFACPLSCDPVSVNCGIILLSDYVWSLAVGRKVSSNNSVQFTVVSVLVPALYSVLIVRNFGSIIGRIILLWTRAGDNTWYFWPTMALSYPSLPFSFLPMRQTFLLFF